MKLFTNFIEGYEDFPRILGRVRKYLPTIINFPPPTSSRYFMTGPFIAYDYIVHTINMISVHEHIILNGCPINEILGKFPTS